MDDRWPQYWVNKYRWALEMRGDVDQDDLMQAARVGMWIAEQTYKPEAGKWSTYSAFWIRREIRKALGVKSGQLPPPEVHLDEPLTEDAEETRLDMLADDSLPDVHDSLLEDEFRRGVREAVDRLEDQEQREVVKRKYFQAKRTDDIAAEMQASSSRIYQLWENAKRRLRRDKALRELAELRPNYYLHVGVDRFRATHTSAVEQALITLEQERERLERIGVQNEVHRRTGLCDR